MFIHVTCVPTPLLSISRPLTTSYRGPDEGQVQRAKALTEDLLEVVKQEHDKMKAVLAQQQMELHQAQVQYAAYSAYAVCICSHALLLSVQSPVDYNLSHPAAFRHRFALGLYITVFDC